MVKTICVLAINMMNQLFPLLKYTNEKFRDLVSIPCGQCLGGEMTTVGAPFFDSVILPPWPCDVWVTTLRTVLRRKGRHDLGRRS